MDATDCRVGACGDRNRRELCVCVCVCACVFPILVCAHTTSRRSPLYFLCSCYRCSWTAPVLSTTATEQQTKRRFWTCGDGCLRATESVRSSGDAWTRQGCLSDNCVRKFRPFGGLEQSETTPKSSSD